jgi:hypothetical protein
VINTDEVPLDAEISAIFVNAGHHQACSIELTENKTLVFQVILVGITMF